MYVLPGWQTERTVSLQGIFIDEVCFLCFIPGANVRIVTKMDTGKDIQSF